MSIDNLIKVSGLLKANSGLFAFDENKYSITSQIDEIAKSCKELGIDSEQVADKMSLKLKAYLFPNLIYYEQLSTHFEADFVNEEFSILSITGNYCHHNKNAGSLEFDGASSNEFQLHCTNVFNYFKLYNYFKSTEFANHQNDANNEIIFYSEVNGIFKIKYKTPPSLRFSESISSSVANILDISSKPEFKPFFKNSLFGFAKVTNDITVFEMSIDDIIINSNKILEVTLRDYELASKKFDFKKFKDSLLNERDRYFESIRDIVNKIFSQAIGIPISISATVFASYKVSDDLIVLFIVLLAFLTYVVFYIRLQFVYKNNISELRQDFEYEFEIIKINSGLESDEIEKEKAKIIKRISETETIINSLIIVIMVLCILVITYITYLVCNAQVIKFIKSII